MIVAACLLPEFTYTNDRVLSSIALREELSLLMSYFMSLCLSRIDESALVATLCTTVLKLNQVQAKGHSTYELQVSDKYSITARKDQPPTNILQLTCDVLTL